MHPYGFMILYGADTDSVAVCTVQKHTKMGLPSPQLYSPEFVSAHKQIRKELSSTEHMDMLF